MKRRRELGEPEPLPGSKEASRNDRLKFLMKVYSTKEDMVQEDIVNQFVHDAISDVLDDTSETMFNFHLISNIETKPEVFTPPSPIMAPKNVNNPSLTKKIKSDIANRYRIKKSQIVKRENCARRGNKTSTLERSMFKNSSSIKHPINELVIKNENPTNNLTRMEDHSLNTNLSFENKPQFDQPSSSNDNTYRKSDENSCSSIRNPSEYLSLNEDFTTFLNSLKPRIQSFSEFQFLDLQLGIIQLIKKIKYPDRE